MPDSYLSLVWFPLLAGFLLSCGTSPAPQRPSANPGAPGTNTPMRSFSEDIESPLRSLQVRHSEQIFVPTTIRNTTQTTWSSDGKYPITVSYKWFDHGTMLPIEGERTTLPAPLKPGDSVPLRVKVIAPDAGTVLTLKISLVQEGVQWFMFGGAKPLELPVTLQ